MPTNKTPIARRPKRRGRFAADRDQQRRSRAPLQWWRADGCPRLDPAGVAELRTALSKLYLLAHPIWPEAVAGDASAVVRVAMTIRYDVASPTWLIDCAGSLALLSAAEGSETAAAILRHLRERYVVPARCRAQRSA
jgi:hypothetical protein